MGLMDFLEPFGTGYIEARVEAMETAAKIKADKKKFDDELNAQTTAKIKIKNAEIDKNYELAEIDKQKKIKDRRNYAIALGFTPEYLSLYGDTILENSTNWSNFLQLGADTYGVTRWWDTPILFRNEGEKGETIQDISLQNKSSFNNNQVTKNTADSVNIPTNSANVTISGETSINKNKTKNNIYGKYYFTPKPERAQSEGEQYINRTTGKIMHGFQLEGNIGQKDFSGNLYATKLIQTDEGVEAQTGVLDTSQWIKLNSENGQLVFRNLSDGFINKVDPIKWSVWDSNTQKVHTLNGIRTIYTNGEIKETINGLNAEYANSLGINLQNIQHFPPPVGETDISTNYLEINKDDFVAATKDMGITLNEVSLTEDVGASNLLRYQAPEELSLASKNSIKSEALSTAGFEEGEEKDFITKPTIGAGLISTFFGSTQASKTANSFVNIVDSSLTYINNQYAKYEQSRAGDNFKTVTPNTGFLNDDMGMFSKTAEGITLADELGLPDIDPQKIDRTFFITKVAQYYKVVRENLTKNEIDKIEKFTKDKEEDIKIELQDGTKGFAYDEYIKENNVDTALLEDSGAIASVIVDKRLEDNVKSLTDLLRVGVSMKEDVEIRTTTAESKIDIADSRAVNKYFPPSEAAMGADFESFVDDYVIDPDNETQKLDLINAIVNLTDDDQEKSSLIKRANQYLETGRKEKYPFPKEKTLFQVRKTEREGIDLIEKNIIKKEIGLDNIIQIDGKSDYSKVIENIGYVQPEKETGVRVGAGLPNKLLPINKLIKELNNLELLGETIRQPKAQKVDKDAILKERKDRIIRLKDEIERQLINLKRNMEIE